MERAELGEGTAVKFYYCKTCEKKEGGEGNRRTCAKGHY